MECITEEIIVLKLTKIESEILKYICITRVLDESFPESNIVSENIYKALSSKGVKEI